MDIERINDNTVKFYISYVDIEERGFDREEIWYNRERSEELFWEMMDEVHQEEDFALEGPLWIQVQALDKGLEILVTKAQISKDGQKFELPIPDEKMRDLPVYDKIEELLDQHFRIRHDTMDLIEDTLKFVFVFKNFEDVIALSYRIWTEQFETKLYHFEGKYYLYVEFDEMEYEDDQVDDCLSIFLEYGQESQMTIHRLMEYGKPIFENDVFVQIRKYFSK